MIIPRQKLFGEVKRTNKAARRKWEMNMVKNNLEKDPTFTAGEDVTLTLMKNDRKQGQLGKEIDRSLENLKKIKAGEKETKKIQKNSNIPEITRSDARLHNFRGNGRAVSTGNIWEDYSRVLSFSDFSPFKSKYTLEELEELKCHDPEKFQVIRKKMATAAREEKERVREALKQEELKRAEEAKEAMRKEIKEQAPDRLKNIRKLNKVSKLKKAAPYAAAGTLVAAGTVAGVKALKKKKSKKEE